MIWRCPKCRGEFAEVADGLRCQSCASHYEVIGGIPDLRLSGLSWVDYEKDRANARRLLAETTGFTTEQVVRHVYASREHWDEERINRRTRQVMAAPTRLRQDIRGWLQPCLAQGEMFLDLGCGPGMLLAAAAEDGYQGIGIDVSLTWLIVAQRLIADCGGRPVLAAALAESLPLTDGLVKSVISLDVIEHVADPAPYLREINRVVKRGGSIALATPNRFSLTAEPHVGIWGVGWLPRSLQKRYVQWRGKDYDYVRLVSTREVGRLLRWNTRFKFAILIPRVSDEEISHFPTFKAWLARFYNRLVSHNWTRLIFLRVGPFFHVVGTKRE